LRVIVRGLAVAGLNIWVVVALPALSRSSVQDLQMNPQLIPVLSVMYWAISVFLLASVQFVWKLRQHVYARNVVTVEYMKELFVYCALMNAVRLGVTVVVMYFWHDDIDRYFQLYQALRS
jgi:hypothetical protein